MLNHLTGLWGRVRGCTLLGLFVRCLRFRGFRRRGALRFWSGLLGILVFTSSCGLAQMRPDRPQTPPMDEVLAGSARTVYVHLFEWRWEDIAQECETSLGPAGYGAVQISPPQEHIVLPDYDFPWWQRYQPVSYQLTSRSGDRPQLVDMIRRCHDAGVKVYADAVINHMAGFEAGVGSAGTEFTKYEYLGLYGDRDFNTCRRPIETYQVREEVTDCELVGLADLDTASPAVQQTIVDYLADLVALGIDGFRIDAAKHIPADDLGAILTQLRSRVDPDPFIYQEVIDPGNEAIRKTEYYGNGHVLEAEYGRIVSESFMELNGRTLAQLERLGEDYGLVPEDQALVFIDNHDKQRGHAGGGNYLTYKDRTLYELATIFMLAYPYGYPQVMSSYAFEGGDQGPPAEADGSTRSTYANGVSTCGQEWICEHRWNAIATMVDFRNQTTGYDLNHWWSNGSDQIAFGRGERGFVVINRNANPLTHTFDTDLPAGRYCNVLTRGDCSEIVVVDDDGRLTTTVDGQGAIALLSDQTPEPIN